MPVYGGTELEILEHPTFSRTELETEPAYEGMESETVEVLVRIEPVCESMEKETEEPEQRPEQLPESEPEQRGVNLWVATEVAWVEIAVCWCLT